MKVSIRQIIISALLGLVATILSQFLYGTEMGHWDDRGWPLPHYFTSWPGGAYYEPLPFIGNVLIWSTAIFTIILLIKIIIRKIR